MEQFDTKAIQWESVKRAMFRDYGFTFDGQRSVFVWRSDSRVVGSIGTAIKLHNSSHTDAKIVDRAKLQWCKRKKKLICQSHLVKFVKSKDAIAQ